MSISEEEYFNMINNTTNVKTKPIDKKPIYEVNRDNNGKVYINAKKNTDTLFEDNIEVINAVMKEYITISERLNIETKMYKILYEDTKKEKYKNQINITKEKLIDNNLKIKALIKLKERYNGE